MLRTFILNADGSVSLSKEKPAAQSKLAEILELLQRGDYEAAGLMRLISIEIKRAKSNMPAPDTSSELQKHRQRLQGLYLVQDYVEATSTAVDPGEHKFDRADLKIVEGEVFRFLREVAFREDGLVEAGMQQASPTETFGEVSSKFMIELIDDGMPYGSCKRLLWDGKDTFIQDHVELQLNPRSDSGAVRSGPPNVDPTIRQAILFPSRFVPSHSTLQLFDDIGALVQRSIHLSSERASPFWRVGSQTARQSQSAC